MKSKSHWLQATATIGLATLAIAVPAAQGARQSRTEAAEVTPRLFAPDSFWNAPIGAAELDPRSPAITDAVVTDVRAQIRAGTGPWISTTSYSTPLYRVPATQPRVKLTLDTGAWGDSLRRRVAAGVPIPAGARPAAGTDGHLTVCQPETDTLWEFWRAVRKADGWHASWGGVMRDASTSPGHFRDRRNAAGTIVEQRNWGATATSLPMIGGTIMVDEVRRGRIDHALALDVPNPCAGSFSWPAQRTDGRSTASDCLPEGARLRLDPDLELSTLRMPPFTRMLAEAAQRYGIVVRDRTGAATGFYAEDPYRYGRNVWAGTTEVNGLLGGKPWNLVRDQFPWARLQLVQMQLNRS